MAMIGAAAGLAGSVMGAMGAQQAANAQADAKNAQANQERIQGVAENAAKQRTALDEDRELKSKISDARAGLAASGGGVTTGSALVSTEELAKKGINKRDLTLWEGRQQQQDRYEQGKELDREAEAERKAGQTSAVASVIGGVSGVFKGASGGAVGGGGGGGGDYFYG